MRPGILRARSEECVTGSGLSLVAVFCLWTGLIVTRLVTKRLTMAPGVEIRYDIGGQYKLIRAVA